MSMMDGRAEERVPIQHYTLPFQYRRSLERVINFVFPDERERCGLCHRLLITGGDSIPDFGQGLCMFCQQDLMQVQATPFTRNFTSRDNRVRVQVVSAAPNRGVTRRTIRQWKYDAFLAATPWLANLLIDGIRQVSSMQLEDGPLPFDAIVPVPTSLARLRAKGYDHAALLAKQVSQTLHLPMHQALFERQSPQDAVARRSQTTLSKRDRAKASIQRYGVTPSLIKAGATVLLVDDIVTTGSTLKNCANALIESGVYSITAATIAWEE